MPKFRQIDFGVADVQVAVRLRRKARGDAAAVLAARQVLVDDLADEINRRRDTRDFVVRHTLAIL